MYRLCLIVFIHRKEVGSMKNNIQFQSPFAQYMTNYIKEKESLGFKSLEIKYILADIDRFLYSAGAEVIDEPNLMLGYQRV